jgi:hypothetical protein
VLALLRIEKHDADGTLRQRPAQRGNRVQRCTAQHGNTRSKSGGCEIFSCKRGTHFVALDGEHATGIASASSGSEPRRRVTPQSANFNRRRGGGSEGQHAQEHALHGRYADLG